MADLERTDFGDNFTWGVAHAAYQVEGAWDADGKGPSIWDTFTARRNKVRDHTDGRVACDFHRLYEDDTQLVTDLGFDAQRFSISWPRVMPDGTGKVNQAGIDFYSRVVDACLERGVEPWITLYHWDLPEALHQRGGWPERSIVGWFEAYADVVTKALGDRVKHWMVFNEPCSFLFAGYLGGVHAPGIRSPRKTLAATHHVALAQAAGARVIRSNVPEAVVGTTHIFTPPVVEGDGERHQRAARSFDASANRLFLEPNLGMGYPVDDSPWIGQVERFVRSGDDDAIKVDFDFLGVQYYQRLRVRPAPIPKVGMVPAPRRDFRSHRITAMGWEVDPTGLYDVLAQAAAYDRFGRLYVTENGAAFPDTLVGDRVHDHDRIGYYHAHLAEVSRAISDGMPVHGYFCWSLMDNFEWAEGFVPRFGLVHVDFDTQVRTVKDSGRWFQAMLRA